MADDDEHFNEALDNDWDEEDSEFCECPTIHSMEELDSNLCDCCGKNIGE